MVMECCYCGKKKDKEPGGHRTFHQFPLKQSELLKAWLRNMRLGPSFKPLKSMRLCSDHFSTELLQKIGVNVQLAEGSIPTRFGSYKSACAYCTAIKTQEHHRSFHKFPLRNPILLQKWLDAMSKKDFFPDASSQLCSDHFERTCFRSSGYGTSLRLTANAIPTIFKSILLEGVVESTNFNTSEESHSAAKRLRLETNFDEPITTAEHDEDFEFSRACTSTEGLVCDAASNEMPGGALTPTCSRQQTVPNTAERIYMTTHDHQYENTPRTTRKKLISSKKLIKGLQEEVRVHKQQITRLKKRISSLKDIVSELHRTRALPDSGLACLDSIAQDDVSQFIKRYARIRKILVKKKLFPKKGNGKVNTSHLVFCFRP